MPNIALLLLQIVVILVAARLVGGLFKRIGQPQVIGEMLAGILLGPSLLGWVAPNVYATLFPPASLGFLTALSQLGLILFMFLIGLELDARRLRERAGSAVVISQVSILAPFVLGVFLAVYLYPRVAEPGVPVSQFAIFMGVAMSITAFPVLARILTDRRLLRTELGMLAITCAAVDDVTAWCLLAAVVLFVHATDATTSLWFLVGGTIAYVLAMLFAVRPALRRLTLIYQRDGALGRGLLALILMLVLLSAWVTESLGIHALFGAFLMGAIMPKEHSFVATVSDKLEDLTVVLLLPLFFALTGLRMSVGLLNGWEMWVYTLLIIAVAVVGKLGGAMLAGRATGLTWHSAGVLGILMNTRGLVELVVLTVGLDIGIIGPTVFTMMVIMALVTTLMTTPLVDWLFVRNRQLAPPEPAIAAASGISGKSD
ncbi:MAG: cation:proton antiporter [Anaerolineae bacterium]